MRSECRLVLGDYLFDLCQAYSMLERSRAEYDRVLVEGPPGFMKFVERVAREIASLFGVKVYMRLDPVYGGCDVGYNFARRVGAKLIIHLGHRPYPFYDPLSSAEGNNGVSVVYVPGVRVKDSEVLARVLPKILGILRSRLVRRVCIGYVVQHELLAESLSRELEKVTEEVSMAEVLGCYYSNAIRRGCELVLVIAGGFFHVIGAGLYMVSQGIDAPLYRVDPYAEAVESAWQLVDKILRSRYFKVYSLRTLRPRSVLVIVGTKPGQYRPSVVRRVVEMLEQHGISYTLAASDRLDENVLNNIPPEAFDAVVVTSCPRLAIDDLADYWRPVVTPGELEMALKGLDVYKFWF